MKIYENETIITNIDEEKKVFMWCYNYKCSLCFLSIFNQKQLMQKMLVEKRFKNDSFWLIKPFLIVPKPTKMHVYHLLKHLREQKPDVFTHL